MPLVDPNRPKPKPNQPKRHKIHRHPLSPSTQEAPSGFACDA
jgi:hypothetical protein